MTRPTWPINDAREAASEVLSHIIEYIDRFEVCGGIRRCQVQVHDVDLVIMEKDRFMINSMLPTIGARSINPGENLLRFTYKDIPFEFNYARNEREFEVLKTVRTGDYVFSRSMAQVAMQKGFVFRFAGKAFGLYKILSVVRDKENWHKKEYIINWVRAPEYWREEDMIITLFGKYYPPEERNWFDDRGNILGLMNGE